MEMPPVLIPPVLFSCFDTNFNVFLGFYITGQHKVVHSYKVEEIGFFPILLYSRSVRLVITIYRHPLIKTCHRLRQHVDWVIETHEHAFIYNHYSSVWKMNLSLMPFMASNIFSSIIIFSSIHFLLVASDAARKLYFLCFFQQLLYFGNF